MAPASVQPKIYTVHDIYHLPEGQRAELIDGQIYNMVPPNRIHQKLINRLSQTITNHIDRKQGDCEVSPAPFAVFLNKDNKNYVEPDISVICDKKIMDDWGCNGAPDWIIEIISPSTQQMDYGIKLFKYRTAGVREYWIVNPTTQTVNIYDFEHEKGTCQYSFQDPVPSCIYHELVIQFSELVK